MLGVIIISIICMACAFLLWYIADKRGANTWYWAFMGALFGPFAIPFIFLTKNNSSKSTQSKQPEN